MASYFLDLPLDVHYLILEACSPNDQVCLRLASKRLYALPNTNQSVSSEVTNRVTQKIPLTQFDVQGLCCDTTLKPVWRDNHLQSYQCHALSKAEDLRQKMGARGEDTSQVVAEPAPTTTGARARPGVRGCVAGFWGQHCECFNRPLYKRLDSWIRAAKGQDFRYCSQCTKFTKRKRWHSGRCYHGRGKPRKEQHEFWTFKKGKGGYRWK